MNIFYTLCTCVFIISSLFATEEKETKAQTEDIKKISEAFGHLMGKNLETVGLHFDISAVIKGLQDATEGKDSPMTEIECIKAITEAQEVALKEEAKKNLSLAETFLKKNSSLAGVVSIEEGKVQYTVNQAGTGPSLTEESTPLIRYKGKFLNGKIFGESTEDEPISMEELIPGLRSALIGMKEGEKRTIYIHPDKGYGIKGTLPPNSLLTFEIEIIKASSSEHSFSQEDSFENPELLAPELASPLTPIETLK